MLPVLTIPSKPQAARATWRHRWGRRLILFGLLVALILARTQILRGLASLLITENPGGRVTAIWLFPCDQVHGALMHAEAARQVAAGEAAEVILVEDAPRRLQKAGILRPPAAIDRQALLARGVPEESLREVKGTAQTDWDQARALLGWLHEHPNDQARVLCDRFGSRRLRLLLDRVLGPEASRVHLVAVPDRHYDETNWWRNKDGIVGFWTGFTHLSYVALAGEGDRPDPPWDEDAWEGSLP